MAVNEKSNDSILTILNSNKESAFKSNNDQWDKLPLRAKSNSGFYENSKLPSAQDKTNYSPPSKITKLEFESDQNVQKHGWDTTFATSTNKIDKVDASNYNYNNIVSTFNHDFEKQSKLKDSYFFQNKLNLKALNTQLNGSNKSPTSFIVPYPSLSPSEPRSFGPTDFKGNDSNLTYIFICIVM